MKIQWKKLIICIIIPLAVGAGSAFLIKDSVSIFQTLEKPPIAPPAWLFPVVWTVLYILMGIASYLILIAKQDNRTASRLYGLQIIFNFFWPILFFNLELYLFSFIWLVALWLLVLMTIISFYKLSKPAGYLMIPLLLWITFAGYLNFSIYLLNR